MDVAADVCVVNIETAIEGVLKRIEMVRCVAENDQDVTTANNADECLTELYVTYLYYLSLSPS